MNREVTLRPEAERDVARIADYTIEQWGKSQARVYVTELRHVIQALESNGLRHPPAEYAHLGLRRVRSGHHLVFYLIDAETVEVIRILHEKQDFARPLG